MLPSEGGAEVTERDLKAQVLLDLRNTPVPASAADRERQRKAFVNARYSAVPIEFHDWLNMETARHFGV